MCISPNYITTKSIYRIHSQGDSCLLPKNKEMEVPCGKCIDCLRQRQNDWYIRITEELKDAAQKGIPALFVTLTYAPDKRPKIEGYESLRREDVRDYLKRIRIREKRGFVLRHKVGYKGNAYKIAPKDYISFEPTGRTIRYFVTGEYSKSGMPHYHLIITGLTKSDFIYRHSWDWRLQFGITDVRTVDNGRKSHLARYLSKYVAKPNVFDFYKSPAYSVVQKEYNRASTYFGYSYWLQMNLWHRALDKEITGTKFHQRKVRSELIYSRLNYVDSTGIQYRLPKYYAKRIYRKEALSLPNTFIDCYEHQETGERYSRKRLYKERAELSAALVVAKEFRYLLKTLINNTRIKKSHFNLVKALSPICNFPTWMQDKLRKHLQMDLFGELHLPKRSGITVLDLKYVYNHLLKFIAELTKKSLFLTKVDIIYHPSKEFETEEDCYVHQRVKKLQERAQEAKFQEITTALMSTMEFPTRTAAYLYYKDLENQKKGKELTKRFVKFYGKSQA